MFKPNLVAAAVLALSACATAPQTRPAASPQPTVQTQPPASGPKALPQRNVTHFADGLRCMDEMLYRFGVRDVSVMVEEMQDQSRRLGAGTRDMMVSAFADMTRRSRGVRLVTFGSDNQNVVQLLSIAQRLNDFKVVPQYDIRGSVTQFDEDVTRKQAGLGVSLPVFSALFGSVNQASVLGFDASVITTSDLSLVPGASSKNTVVVTRDDKGVGDGQAQIRNGSLSFSFGVARNEGVAQSLRNVVELSTIELTGKLLRLPYWTCLNIDTNNAEIQREMEDWFLSMQDTPELTRFFQEQLRNRKFYDGPADGKPNAAYLEALAAHRKAQGLKGEGEPDAEVLRAFLLKPIPKAPEKPFVAPKPEGTGDGANANGPATGTAAGNGPAAGTAAPAGKEIKLSVQLAKTKYRKGEAIEMTVSTAQSGYVYCYLQSPTTGKIQRIFPNRFARDPRIEANTPLVLPGAQGFKALAGAEGVKQQAVGCLATEREVYNELAPELRWGDFEDIRLATFEEIRDAFAQVAKAPVALEGALIDVSDK
jgi:curli biogenesis system outer membrane secretion channel CsgG